MATQDKPATDSVSLSIRAGAARVFEEAGTSKETAAALVDLIDAVTAILEESPSLFAELERVSKGGRGGLASAPIEKVAAVTAAIETARAEWKNFVQPAD